MAERETFVIVGASLTGAKAAETLRAEGFAGRIVLIGAEHEIPYERPPLSKGYLLGKEPRDKAYVHPREWYDEQDIDLRLGTVAEAFDTSSHEVTLVGGERLRYDKLLLATGSTVRRLDVPGADLDGVRYLRQLPDSDALKASFGEGVRVVVVGAGWIGLEVAAAARIHGCDVTVVEVADLPLQRVLGDEVGRVIADLHTEHGVRLLMGAGVEEVRGDGRVSGVRTSTGVDLPADLVVAGIGIKPAVELAEAAGLVVRDGVEVDGSLRTSDPDVFAAGDVANIPYPAFGRRLRVEHWANALNGGPAAAKAMLGQDMTYDRLPYFFSDQYDLGLEYVGWADPRDSQVILRGDVPGRMFQTFWLLSGTVQAAMHANMWDEGIEPLKPLVGRKVDPTRLADPKVALNDV